MNDVVTVRAGAKVNPLLAIHGRRADGFHELTTLMVGLDFCDDVTVSRHGGGQANEITVATTGPHATPDIPQGGTNLAARGAAAALRALGSQASLRIEVEKRIPSRAGLGGGSSDAAAAALATLELLAAERAGAAEVLVGASVEASVLRALGEIGADCAFFFGARSTGAALATGRGENVAPLANCVPDWHLAVVTPEVDCATPAVYGALGLAPSTEEKLEFARGRAGLPDAADLLQRSATEARSALRNDLEPAAVAAFPELARWRKLFARIDAGHFLLAGSGSSFFGLFESARDAQASCDAVRSAAADAGLGLRHASAVRPAGGSLLQIQEGVR